MAFMMITTLVAMSIKMRDFWNLRSYLLLTVGAIVLGLSLWLAVESVLKLKVRVREGEAASPSLILRSNVGGVPRPKTS